MSHTDPQNDVKCRDCGQPTQAKTERCAGCSTPAGLLVTALAVRGVKAKADTRCDVSVDILAITVEEEEWTISSMEATHAETVEAAADAIAAIVQAPGLQARIAELEAHNGRMVAQILALANGFDLGAADMANGRVLEDAAWRVVGAVPGTTFKARATALRDLAGGAS